MLLSFAAAADGPVAAGNVTLLTGTATAASTNGWQRALARGAPVYSGDVVETGPSSYAQLKFSDAGAILLRPGTQFRIDSYHYAAAAPAAQPVPRPHLKPRPPHRPAGARRDRNAGGLHLLHPAQGRPARHQRSGRPARSQPLPA